MFEKLLITALITAIIETLVVLLYPKLSKKLLITVIITNVFSNLIMNYILITFFVRTDIYMTALMMMEIGAFLLEGFIYYLVTKNLKVSFLLSLIANILSYMIGILF